MKDDNICAHLAAIDQVKTTDSGVCAECIRNGSGWVHLRVCQTCGETLCCDDSPGKHMTKHYHATSHPVISSAQPGERWLWCYRDQQMVDY